MLLFFASKRSLSTQTPSSARVARVSQVRRHNESLELRLVQQDDNKSNKKGEALHEIDGGIRELVNTDFLH